MMAMRGNFTEITQKGLLRVALTIESWRVSLSGEVSLCKLNVHIQAMTVSSLLGVLMKFISFMAMRHGFYADHNTLTDAELVTILYEGE
jgi:hypothetical protein